VWIIHWLRSADRGRSATFGYIKASCHEHD